MASWQAAYDALAGERYPRLLAYAELHTGDGETADALVARALERTFAHGRRDDAVAAGEEQVRAQIARLWVRAAPRTEVPALPARSGSDPLGTLVDDTDADEDAGPAPAPHPYAPPEPEGASAGPAVTPANPYAPPVADADPGAAGSPPSRASDPGHDGGADVPATAEPDSPDDPLATALAALDARTRSVVILTHLDGQSPRAIADLTGMRRAEVEARLAVGEREIENLTGMAVGESRRGSIAQVAVTVEPGGA